jgi:hypothetical protein
MSIGTSRSTAQWWELEFRQHNCPIRNLYRTHDYDEIRSRYRYRLFYTAQRLITTVASLAAWEEKRKQSQRKIYWQFTTKDTRIKLHNLYSSL